MTGQPASAARNTRSEILLAAHNLFAENGFHGTSMRRIAQEANIALGGIYNHFSSKEDIFTAIFLEMHPYREMIERIMLAQGSGIEAILQDASARLNDGVLERPDQFLALMFIELVEFKGRHISHFFQEIFPQFVLVGQRFFSDRQKLRDLPPLMMLRALLGLYFSYFMTEWIFGTNLPEEARQNGLARMTDIYLHGIMKPDCNEAA